jgi:hypothetical protein
MCTTSKIMVVQGGAVVRSDLHHHHPHIMGWCGVAEQGHRNVVVQIRGGAGAR